MTDGVAEIDGRWRPYYATGPYKNRPGRIKNAALQADHRQG